MQSIVPQTPTSVRRLSDCGMLPVTNKDNQLIGVVTDRDICIAMGTRGRLAGEPTMGEVAVTNVFTCRPDVDKTGIPPGILSMEWEGSCELSAEETIRSFESYAKPSTKEHVKAKAA